GGEGRAHWDRTARGGPGLPDWSIPPSGQPTPSTSVQCRIVAGRRQRAAHRLDDQRAADVETAGRSPLRQVRTRIARFPRAAFASGGGPIPLLTFENAGRLRIESIWPEDTHLPQRGTTVVFSGASPPRSVLHHAGDGEADRTRGGRLPRRSRPGCLTMRDTRTRRGHTGVERTTMAGGGSAPDPPPPGAQG